MNRLYWPNKPLRNRCQFLLELRAANRAYPTKFQIAREWKGAGRGTRSNLLGLPSKMSKTLFRSPERVHLLPASDLLRRVQNTHPYRHEHQALLAKRFDYTARLITMSEERQRPRLNLKPRNESAAKEEEVKRTSGARAVRAQPRLRLGFCESSCVSEPR